VGVILAGEKEACVCIVRDFVLSLDGKKEATLLSKGKEKVPSHLAALVNGTAGHSMDWDDTALSNTPDREVLLHPTLPPLVAGLAIGEKLKVSGREFLTAFLVVRRNVRLLRLFILIIGHGAFTLPIHAAFLAQPRRLQSSWVCRRKRFATLWGLQRVWLLVLL
jgi:hypothetical protein